MSSLLLWCGLVCHFSQVAEVKRIDLFLRLGPNTKVMRKAKMSFQSGQVKQVIRTYAVEVQTGDRKDLEAETVTMKLRKAMGANCESSILR